MPKAPNLSARLVANTLFSKTQIQRICPKALLDTALLARRIPRASLQAKLADGSSLSTIRECAKTAERAQRISDWKTLESQAMLALPGLSPSGILQFLFLSSRGNYQPIEFLQELQSYLLHDEPGAPPVTAFWRLWHAFIDDRLFVKIHSCIASSLSFFSGSDVALILEAAASVEADSIPIRYLFFPVRESSIENVLQVERLSALQAPGPAACQPEYQNQHGFPPHVGTNSGKDIQSVSTPPEGCTLFEQLLRTSLQNINCLPPTDVIRIFFAGSAILKSAMGAANRVPDNWVEGLDDGANAYFWKASFIFLFRIGRHASTQCIYTSPKARLRIVAGAFLILGLLLNHGARLALTCAASDEWTNAIKSILEAVMPSLIK